MKFSLKTLLIFATVAACIAAVAGYAYQLHLKEQRDADAIFNILESSVDQSVEIGIVEKANSQTGDWTLALHGKEIAKSFDAKVVGITDGDTIKVLVDNQEIKVRLESIDTPEKNQPFGDKAKQALSAFVFGETVTIFKTGEDHYGRTLGFVFVDKKDVCKTMVEIGLAWNYVEYSNSVELVWLEEKSKEAKMGLWAGDDPIPPWEWRKKK